MGARLFEWCTRGARVRVGAVGCTRLSSSQVWVHDSSSGARVRAGAVGCTSTRSGVALSELLHADAYIVRARRTLATPTMDCTSMIGLGDGIVEVVTRIGLFCCEARLWDESCMLNKMGRKIYY